MSSETSYVPTLDSLIEAFRAARSALDEAPPSHGSGRWAAVGRAFDELAGAYGSLDPVEHPEVARSMQRLYESCWSMLMVAVDHPEHADGLDSAADLLTHVRDGLVRPARPSILHRLSRAA